MSLKLGAALTVLIATAAPMALAQTPAPAARVRAQLPATRPTIAQTPAVAAPAAGDAALQGPLVPGVCLISQVAVLQTSKAGIAMLARIKQLSDQAQAEVDAENAPLQAEIKVLDANKKMKPADKTAKGQALAVRLQALQAKATLRTREIDATRQKALARIAAQVPALIPALYKAHNCGLLFEKSAVLAGNMGGDLTPEVIAGLDARMPTITFDRETLPEATAPVPGR